MTQQFLNNMQLMAIGMIVLGIATVLVAAAFVWSGFQERKFREEGFDYEWEDEQDALARVFEYPIKLRPYDQERAR